MLIVTKNVQTERNHKLQQINEWKQFNLCFFIVIEIVQFHNFS